MGYLNNKEITVDAILTKAGRELLANNQPLNIVRFALSDDEVDYTLWNPAHPMGSDFYGQAILNLPLLEPVPASNASMLSLLYTPNDGNAPTMIPRIQLPGELGLIMLNGPEGHIYRFAPLTINGNNSSYRVELVDDTYCMLSASYIIGSDGKAANVDNTKSKIKTGTNFNLYQKAQPNATGMTTSILITGIQTGTTISIPVVIERNIDPTIPQRTDVVG